MAIIDDLLQFRLKNLIELDKLVCRHYAKSKCYQGEKCLFPHVEVEGKILDAACRYYLQNKCIYGKICLYDHVNIVVRKGKKFVERVQAAKENLLHADMYEAHLSRLYYEVFRNTVLLDYYETLREGCCTEETWENLTKCKIIEDEIFKESIPDSLKCYKKDETETSKSAEQKNVDKELLDSSRSETLRNPSQISDITNTILLFNTVRVDVPKGKSAEELAVSDDFKYEILVDSSSRLPLFMRSSNATTTNLQCPPVKSIQVAKGTKAESPTVKSMLVAKGIKAESPTVKSILAKGFKTDSPLVNSMQEPEVVKTESPSLKSMKEANGVKIDNPAVKLLYMKIDNLAMKSMQAAEDIKMYSPSVQSKQTSEDIKTDSPSENSKMKVEGMKTDISEFHLQNNENYFFSLSDLEMASLNNI